MVEEEDVGSSGCPRFCSGFPWEKQQRAGDLEMALTKRLLVWLGETTSQALLLSLLLSGLFGHDQYTFGRGLVIYAGEILIMFTVTGYVLTTAIARAMWRRDGSRFYPLVCTALFVIHFELLNVGIGGAFAPPDRRTVLAVGSIAAFLTTLAGTLVLRQRTAVKSNQFRLQL